MPFGLKSLTVYSIVVFISLCIECGSLQMQTAKSNLSEVSKIDVHKFSDLNLKYDSGPNSLTSNKTNVYLEESVKNDSSSTKTVIDGQEVQKVSTRPEDLKPEFALEGGGIGFPSRNSSVKSQDDGVFGEEIHNRGSKGRKGVQLPGSSVVPRKGVGLGLSVEAGQLGDFLPNDTKTVSTETLTNNSLSNNNTKTAIDRNASLSISYEITKPQVMVQTQVPTMGILNITHSKKPEYVSDEKDVDDFEKYSIIKTSTTGEDYVIIGIVIVIGIWLSVFGALIFYRRAGEYWDRRHYRRMDFLVEGMYND